MEYKNLRFPPTFSLTITTMGLRSVDLLEDTRELIQRCIKGDRCSQTILMKGFPQKCFQHVFGIKKSPAGAEEILQEGFVQIMINGQYNSLEVNQKLSSGYRYRQCSLRK